MSELLAPAGNYEAFINAINAGCNAVYLGLNSFSARAYANNFTLDEVKELVEYAHLRNVLVFVTMNTIIFQDELPLAYKTIDELARIGVDALIIQDLALLSYVAQKYPNMEAHASTQMGVDDIEGINLLEQIGVKRVVLSREVSIDKIKELKKQTKMPLETFIHGALCVSYSGNCLMSGLIGMRSGNRGRCVGSCRKLYSLVNLKTGEESSKQYLLSMKDLNATKNIDELKIVDSLKIEGRMKEASYVYSVVRSYRETLDNPYVDINLLNDNLSKTFHRTFTKGYIFGEKPENITNIKKPNNFGYYIGKVINKKGRLLEIKLTNTLNQGDQIRFDLEDINEVSLPIVKMYDKEHNFIKSSSTTAYIECSEKINIGTNVYKTKDIVFLDELEKKAKDTYYKIYVDMFLTIDKDNHLVLTINYEEHYVSVYSSEQIALATNTPTSLDNIKRQLEKLGNTPYTLRNFDTDLENKWFIPVSVLNNLRRAAIEKLNKKRLSRDCPTNNNTTFTKQIFPITKPTISVSVKTLEQYNIVKSLGIDNIYFDNVIPRNNADYENTSKSVLVGGLGGLNFYKNNYVTTDYSFNVVNAESVNLLHNLGANLVTISHEINKQQLNLLINEYYKQNGGYPNLEMIVYGHQEMLHTKYCPIKKMGFCGKCKTQKFALKDDFETFPLITSDNCEVTLLNGKTLNLIDEVPYIKNINSFRLAFTIEDEETIIKTVNALKDKLNGKNHSCFNKETDTRGHFNKEIL